MTNIYKLMGMFMLVIFSIPTFSQNNECQNRNQNFRSARDIAIIQTVNEPFNTADIDTFQGLYYFPIDCNSLFNGKIYKNDPMKVINVQTTKGQTVSVYDYGTVVVNLGGEDYSLKAYKNIDIPDFNGQETIFIPFKDKTSGKTTYEHGRYLLIDPKGTNVVLDFNMAANPWENYNGIHSTLIVPESNVIQGPVQTGERKYEDR
jgi:uncharacterized protein (DUF1684 family)